MSEVKKSELILQSYMHWITDNLIPSIAWYKHDTPFCISFESDCCALCNEFNTGNENNPCRGCPVKTETEKKYCGGTPFYTVTELFEGRGTPYYTVIELLEKGCHEDKKKAITAIAAECLFLKRLYHKQLKKEAVKKRNNKSETPKKLKRS